MAYTMEDFRRDFIMKHWPQLTAEEQAEVLQHLPLEKRLAGLSLEQIQEYLDRRTAEGPAAPRRRQRKN